MKKYIALILALALVICVFAGCSEKKTETRVITMGTNAAFPPYEFYEGEQIVGIDAEIAAAIAAKLGATLKIEDMEFGSIIGAVQTGKIDIGMAGMTVTEERLKSVNFSNTYATGIQSIIVKEDSPITSVNDLSSDLKYGVQQDTTGDIFISGDFGDEAVERFNKGADAVQALVTDKVDCVVIDNEPAKSFVEANKGLKILDTAYAVEDYAIAINKDKTDFLKEVNDALAALIKDGTVQNIVDKYIGK